MKIFSPLAQFDVVAVVSLFFRGKYEISLTNLTFSVFIVLLIGIVVFYWLYRNHVIPRNWQIVLESIFIFIYRVVFQQLGKEGLMYFSFLFSLFSFILLLNLYSLLPFSFAATSHLIWTLYFSLSICLGIFFIGILKHKIDFFKLFVPEVPFLLYPLMILIEIFSYIIRSFSLAIRLSANIIAGHTLVHIIANVIIFMSTNVYFIFCCLPFSLLLAILVLELGIAFLQAYIFILLTCMYLHDSIYLNAH